MNMMNIIVEYDNYHKSLKFKVDGNEYDISPEVPEDIWNIGGRKYPLSPENDWKIRKELRKVFIKYFKKNIDKNIMSEDIIF